MHPALVLVKERSQRPGSARAVFDRDEGFRELCDEYRVCNETATRMRNATEADMAIRNEYMALRLRLEAGSCCATWRRIATSEEPMIFALIALGALLGAAQADEKEVRRGR